jgi:L-ascorbate metabolism protein UlaG (beta-lactamase superfamily)
MKFTRFSQACVLLEKENHKIVIDPGEHFLQAHTLDDLQGVEAVLYTHQHCDHYSPKIADALRRLGAVLYANASTAKLIGTENCTVVNSLDTFNVGGFAVVAYDMPHCRLPGNADAPQNTGFAIDSLLFHPGDSTTFEQQTKINIPVVALPIIGPDISFYDAYELAMQLGATQVIPVHYDLLGARPEAFTAMSGGDKAPFSVTVLGNGEATEIVG